MSLRRSVFLAITLFSLSAFAIEDVDVFLSSRQDLPVPGPLPRATANLVAGGRITGTEPRLGVPTFFWVGREDFAPDLRATGLTPEAVARRALFTYAPLYRLSPNVLAESPLLQVHDLGTGAVIAQFEHRVGGLPVFHERLNVLMNQRLELLALTGSHSALPLLQRDFKLAAPTALALAFEGGFGTAVESNRFQPVGFDEGGGLVFSANTLESHNVSLARAMQVLYPDVDGRQLVPAWYVELEASPRASTASELVGTVVSALDGRVLWRHSLTESDSFGYRVWADPVTLRPLDGPNGRATPHPTGLVDGTVVPFVAPSLITLANAGLSTNDPWLAAGATVTTGNNAEAYVDLVTPDGFNADGGADFRGVITAPGVFGDTFDVTLAPNASPAQSNAGITQMFYTLNWLHDWFYDQGFNEVAGNAQALNFGRGGAEADSIKAEAQDFSGLNNANMSTPADGARPKMQMYNWQVAGFTRVQIAALSIDVQTGTAVFGPSSFDVTGDVVLVNDGTASVTDGCQPILNNVSGKLALLDRGSCTFKTKVRNAQVAGAIGVIIANNSAAAPGTMGDDATITTVITIGAQLIPQATGNAIKTALLGGPVTARTVRTTPPNRDGTLDNTVVAHEWGHYLSNRLVNGISTTQARGMGEGWSDFVALLMTTEEADALQAANPTFGGVYALAVWDSDSTALPTNAPYYGIRRLPYSVDFTKNPFTFKHIANGTALPTIPMSSGGGTNAEVHNTGEIWATMLWESYVALLRATPRLTFAQAQSRMQRYLVAGLKLTPGDPTFTEARDGLLAAAAAEDLADFRLIAQAFARRGAGLLAVAPPRAGTTNSPVVEDFSTGNDVAFVSATLNDEAFYCDRDGILDVGERGRLRVSLKNTGFSSLSAVTATLTTTLPGVTITPSTLTFAAFDPFRVVAADAVVQLPAGLSAISNLNLQVSFNDASLTTPGPRTQTVNFTVNKDSVAAARATDDVEADLVAWTFASVGTPPSTRSWARVETGPLAHRFVGVDAPSTADLRLESPPLAVGPGAFSFTFSNRWSFEFDPTGAGTAFDGAVLELSTDNGTTWTDIGASATPGYTGTLDNTSGNPLGGRLAYTSKSAGYPAFVTTTVSLGTTYAGQTVRVRLRVGTDQGAGDVGWEVDDFVFTGLTNTPFPQAVADRGLCINRPPVANAGPDFAVDERTQVTLSHAASTDPDMNVLTARWTQVSGPSATVVNGQFTAPEVTVNTTLRFSLRVNDGTVDSLNTDDVDVLVRNVNRAPVVNAGMDLTVDERSPFQLPGSATDADGDPLTLVWRQVSGPVTQVADLRAVPLVGVAPDVTADANVLFELRASDGTDATTANVTLHVRQVNRPPSAFAFTDAFVNGGDNVGLTGFVMDPDGDPTTVRWTQTSGPTVVLSSATEVSPRFTAPVVTTDTSLSFTLVASDGTASSAPAQVSLTVRGNNKGPIAVAGADVTVVSGESVQLDGSGSSDPEGGALSFAWQQEEAGSRVTFAGANTAKPTVTAPVVTAGERLTVVLYVRDPQGAVGSATVHLNVTVKPPTGCGCAGLTGVEPLLFTALLLALRRRRNAR